MDDVAPGRAGGALRAPGPERGARLGPTRVQRLRWAAASEHELKLGDGRDRSTTSCSARRRWWPAKRAALFGRAPCIYDVRFVSRTCGASSTTRPRSQVGPPAGVSPPFPRLRRAATALVDSIPEETLRLRPEELHAQGRCRRAGRATSPTAVDDDQVPSTGSRSKPAASPSPVGPADSYEGRPRPCSCTGFPQTLVGLARSSCGRSAASRVPRRRARPARVQPRCTPGRGPGDYATEASPGRRHRPGRFNGDGPLRPCRARLGMHALAWIVASLRSRPGPITQRRVDAAPIGAAARELLGGDPGPGRPGVWPRSRSGRRRSPSGSSSDADGSGRGLATFAGGDRPRRRGLGDVRRRAHRAGRARWRASRTGSGPWTATALRDLGPVTGSHPVRVVDGRRRLRPCRAAEATAGCVSGPYTFEVLENVSHWIPEMAPVELTDLLMRHLSAH